MHKGDRVYAIGLHSRKFGIGTVIDMRLKVATVQFLSGRIESYSVDILKVVEGVKQCK